MLYIEHVDTNVLVLSTSPRCMDGSAATLNLRAAEELIGALDGIYPEYMVLADDFTLDKKPDGVHYTVEDEEGVLNDLEVNVLRHALHNVCHKLLTAE